MIRWCVRIGCIAAFGLGSPHGPSAARASVVPEPRALDLNSASREELLKFDGIGLLYADKIIRGRPYRQRSELVARDILPATVYLHLKYRLFVSPQSIGWSDAKEPSALRDGRMDVNSATREQLTSFRGIGQLYADKIIAGRPYKAAIELVGRRVMPLAAYDWIKDDLVAR